MSFCGDKNFQKGKRERKVVLLRQLDSMSVSIFCVLSVVSPTRIKEAQPRSPLGAAQHLQDASHGGCVLHLHAVLPIADVIRRLVDVDAAIQTEYETAMNLQLAEGANSSHARLIQPSLGNETPRPESNPPDTSLRSQSAGCSLLCRPRKPPDSQYDAMGDSASFPLGRF